MPRAKTSTPPVFIVISRFLKMSPDYENSSFSFLTEQAFLIAIAATDTIAPLTFLALWGYCFTQRIQAMHLLESAEIDGASKWTTFIKIVVPLSRSIMAVMVVFSMVAYWNDWFTALIYPPGQEKAPLPLVLRNILIKSSASASQASTISGGYAELNKLTEMIKFSSIIVAAAPMLVIYPFVQKYFEQGFMAGAVKG